MTLTEVRALLARYNADNFHPPCIENEADYHLPPRLEYRVTETGGTLYLCDWPGGQSDVCCPVESDDQLASILNGTTEIEWENAANADLPTLLDRPAKA